MKKILSIVLSVLMLINALGITTFAGTYSQDGNTYTSNDPSDLPVSDGDKVWEGPTLQSTCDKEAHTHSNSCYELTCGGLSLTHWFHRDSCYDKTKLVCTKEEHQHSSLERMVARILGLRYRKRCYGYERGVCSYSRRCER